MLQRKEEIVGLDSMEHGLASAYSGFSIMDVSNTMTMDINENTDLGTPEYAQASQTKRDAAVKVVSTVPKDATGMYKVVIIAKLSRYDHLKSNERSGCYWYDLYAGYGMWYPEGLRRTLSWC